MVVIQSHGVDREIRFCRAVASRTGAIPAETLDTVGFA